MSDIEKRLLKMEAKLRIYQIIFIGLILGAGFMFLSGFGKRNVVEDLVQAKEFQVVDANGKVIVSLKKDTTGGGRISIYNNKGMNVLYLHSGNVGGRIALSDFNGSSGMVAALTDEGHGVINLYNKTDKRICAMGGDTKGNGGLDVFNAAGQNVNSFLPK